MFKHDLDQNYDFKKLLGSLVKTIRALAPFENPKTVRFLLSPVFPENCVYPNSGFAISDIAPK